MTTLDRAGHMIFDDFDIRSDSESDPERPADTATLKDKFDTDLKREHMVMHETICGCTGRRKRTPAAMWQPPEDVALFTMATVARAAGVEPSTLRAWFQRKHVLMNQADSRAPMNGASSKFTYRSVLMLATMAELVRQGSTPRMASKAAEHWMTHGVLEGQFNAPAQREGGGLFPAPYLTFLIAGDDGEIEASDSSPCRIEGISPRSPGAFNTMFGAVCQGGRPGAKIVFLNIIDSRVRQICHEAILGDAAPAEPDWEAVAAKLIAAEA